MKQETVDRAVQWCGHVCDSSRRLTLGSCQEAVIEAVLWHFGLGLQWVQYTPASGYGSDGLHHTGVDRNHPSGNSPCAWQSAWAHSAALSSWVRTWLSYWTAWSREARGRAGQSRETCCLLPCCTVSSGPLLESFSCSLASFDALGEQIIC